MTVIYPVSVTGVAAVRSDTLVYNNLSLYLLLRAWAEAMAACFHKGDQTCLLCYQMDTCSNPCQQVTSLKVSGPAAGGNEELFLCASTL